MSRKPGPSKHKLELILYALRGSPHGTWVRDIAKKTGLTKSTVSNYLNTHLKDKVEVVHDSKHIKLMKIKKGQDETEDDSPETEPQDLDDAPDYIG